MKKLALVFITVMGTLCLTAQKKPPVNISHEQLKNKIRGGWAGQTIGVTFGGPYEFQFNGTFIGDYQPLLWYDGYLKHTMINNPGLYDDLYMDLTFVDVFEKHGLDAPVDSFANAFANAGYMLWHANQAARYNILHGIKAPASGNWKNNPHADCIDYQIEADFAGLMSPGMPNTASEISDKIGHIMNYGDGWYGGIYVGAMYSLSFTSNDIPFIVSEALKTIPPQSEFYKCIQDVIASYRKYPNDWKQTWLLVQRKWADDIGCPEGVFAPFNIDAKVNAAYVVIGLLYGGGDFTKTMEVTTRCGQDADCNPSTAGGILGTVLGYDKIPAYWKMGLKEAEGIPFKYTTMSLDSVYEIGYRHALKVIEQNGGKINEKSISIQTQTPKAVRFEKSFSGLYPKEKKNGVWADNRTRLSFDFEGTGFVIRGEVARWGSTSPDKIQAELFIDSSLVEKIELPLSYTLRRYEMAWNYSLKPSKHTVELRFAAPVDNRTLPFTQAIIYTDKAIDALEVNKKGM